MSTTGAASVRGDRLPPDLSSPARARALVTEALHAADRDDDAELAALLVSETVTNAVLHAGTDVEVRCEVGDGVVRVEVRDGSPMLPGLRHYDDGAMTGRGLGLVEALAQDWGVETHPAGKTVWFELGAVGHPAGGGADAPAPSSPTEPATTVVVRLLGLPVALVRRTVQYGDAVLRERALLDAADAPGDRPGPLTPPIDLTPILGPVDAAWDAGQVTLDLAVEIPVGTGHAALERLAAVDDADGMARAGLLLSTPAGPEIDACRRWLLGQIAGQVDGGAPAPWRPPPGPGQANPDPTA